MTENTKRSRWKGFSHLGVSGPLLLSLLSVSILFNVFKSIIYVLNIHKHNAKFRSWVCVFSVCF